jgi:hypothetical protein
VFQLRKNSKPLRWKYCRNDVSMGSPVRLQSYINCCNLSCGWDCWCADAVTYCYIYKSSERKLLIFKPCANVECENIWSTSFLVEAFIHEFRGVTKKKRSFMTWLHTYMPTCWCLDCSVMDEINITSRIFCNCRLSSDRIHSQINLL